ncbi:UNKNOWN [Stylonychia lemnae]|uniref:Uncharacterized protein n=1 Tax=Stylonychia lemnae TaxID=5949 RepID=A0A078AUK0_STYLE|nr:UNKNOWN [Stylonychia lemnae]|eukprot:CDW85696.1 UNKNOWN [Stylonychia lemnae]
MKGQKFNPQVSRNMSTSQAQNLNSPKVAVEKKSLFKRNTLDTKQIIADKLKPVKQSLAEQQRFQNSPYQKPMDLNKNAWDRLIDRTFDTKTAQYIKDQKEKEVQKISDQYSQSSSLFKKDKNFAQKQTQAKTANHSPVNNNSSSIKEVMSQPQSPESRRTGLFSKFKQTRNQCQTAMNSKRNSFIMNTINENGAGEVQKKSFISNYKPPQKPTAANSWKKFIDKTSDCKVVKNDTNYCERRTVESFLSGRTINPSQYASQANMLLISDSVKREQNMQMNESELGKNITGCRKKQNEKVNLHQFKVVYSKDELKKDIEQRRDKLNYTNIGHFTDGLKLNESSSTYIGSSKVGCYLQDKTNHQHEEKQINLVINQFLFSPIRNKKNQMDYMSSISCLSPEKARRDPSFDNNKSTGKAKVQLALKNTINQAVNENFLPKSFNTQTSRKGGMNNNSQNQSGIFNTINAGAERNLSPIGRIIPQGFRDMFQSQITKLS